MKSRRKHSFQFMTILYFVIVFCMCVSRFNVIMTIMGGQLTRVEEINLLPFHSVRENLQYGRNPISWDMLYNMVMFVPFGIIYCYYQKHFRVSVTSGTAVSTVSGVAISSAEAAGIIVQHMAPAMSAADKRCLSLYCICITPSYYFYIKCEKITMLHLHHLHQSAWQRPAGGC